MAGNIEARLRIAADVAQAVSALKRLRGELNETGKAADRSKGTGTGKVNLDDAIARRKEAEALAEATRQQRAAERQAAADAKAAIAAQRAAQRAADDEAKKAATALRASKRQQALEDQAAQKASRNDAYKATVLGQQVTDIVSGLATGQKPFTVLLQQGGQLRDVFGSVGGAAKALMAIFTPLRIIVGGVAAAIGAVAYYAVQGAIDTDRLNKGLALTGNIAGTSAGQINAQAQAIAGRQKVAVSDVRDTLSALATSGEFVGASLGSAGRAVTALRKLTGQTAEEAIKDFSGMSDGVAAWAQKSNKAYNYLTVEQFKYVQQLEAQGRTQEAMRVVMDALATTMEGRAAPAIGTIEKLWKAAGKALSDFKDDLASIGKETTAEDRVQALTDKLTKLRAAQALRARNGNKNAFADLQTDQVAQDLRYERKDARETAQAIADKAAELKAAQKAQKEATRAYTDQIAAVNLAGLQVLQAQEMAALDARQSAAETANAKGLTSALAYNLALNRIEQERLAVQAATLQRQRDIEAGRVDEKPEDKLAKAAALKQIDAQLTELRSKIRISVAQGRNLTEADALERARDLSARWADIWQQAAEQVRQFAAQNAATNAANLTDPSERARAQAAAQVADIKRSIASKEQDLQLVISLTLDPTAKAELQRQLAELQGQGGSAVSEQTRLGRLQSLQSQTSEIMQRIQLDEAAIDQQVQAGTLTMLDGQREKFAARAKEIDQLQKINDEMATLASSPGEINAVRGIGQQLGVLKDTTSEVEKTLKSSIGDGFGTLFTDIATGAEKADRAVGNFVVSVAKSMLNLIAKELGQKLVKSLFGSDSGGGSNSGWIAAAATYISKMFHGGGVVGQAGGMSRSVSPAVFAGATRYHGGGIAGLAPNETPAILMKGEEVLTANDPRHRNNLAAGGATVGAVTVNVSVDGGSSPMTQATGQALGNALEAAVMTVLARESRPGGVLAGNGGA